MSARPPNYIKLIINTVCLYHSDCDEKIFGLYIVYLWSVIMLNFITSQLETLLPVHLNALSLRYNMLSPFSSLIAFSIRFHIYKSKKHLMCSIIVFACT